MVNSNSTGSREFSLEEFIALNDEIASLVRSGVPLELGMESVEARGRGRMREAVNRLSTRMRDGASLPEALSAEGTALPQVYRAVVQAGLRTGRLPDALESLSQLSRSVLQLQRRISLSFLYPSIILTIAYFLFVGFVIFLVPQLDRTYTMFELPSGGGLNLLLTLNDTVAYWGPAIPLAVGILLLVGRVQRPRRSVPFGVGNDAERNTALGKYRWFPGMNGIVRNFHLANFTETLALLLDHEVPLPEALVLAAESTGDARLIGCGEKLSARLQLGQSLGESLRPVTEIPHFLKWMMAVGEKQGTLPTTLQQAACTYRSRARNKSQWFQLITPVALVVLIGGGATLIYGLTLLLPLTEMLKQLGMD